MTGRSPRGDDGSNGSGDKLHAWMFNTSDENRAEIDQLTAAETFIMGRNMFEGVPALKLEQVGSRAASSVTHVTYRVLS